MSSIRTPSFDIHGLEKPRLRGLLHAWAIAPFAVAGLVLLVLAPSLHARIAVAIYAVAITGMLSASASYHRLKVSPAALTWLRRLDHSMIGVAVAGTYTPVIALVLTGSLQATLLALLWFGAVGSLLVSFLWPQCPSWVRASVYIALGWAGVAVTPWLFSKGGVAAFTFVVIGALFYTLGAMVYAKHRPNPWPGTYGFHEVFHTLVVLAAASHFVAVVLVVHQTA